MPENDRPVNPFSRIRRNHGLEHATLHILSEKYPRLSLAGHSDMGGFWILGDVGLDEVTEAVDEGLRRMQSGEHNLSIHPNCGTNYVATGVLAGTAAWLGMMGSGRGVRDKMERLPMVIGLATLALMFGQPLGMALQAGVTSSGVPENLGVVRITATKRGKMRAYRVETSG
jgi:hypothetical protein